MGTPGERLEAEIWLETIGPDLSAEQWDAFFYAVDEYYDEHPIADRGPDFLATLRNDDRAFALILDEVINEGRGNAASSAAGGVSWF
ncbi:hypothetical protein ACTXPS_19230 [Brachybacterium tyrofermentans]|uniref:hypothetical protein n=1 Tax=Brachybacterium tyrofermentans TaxID=47848 RepID=UPI003FD14FE8